MAEKMQRNWKTTVTGFVIILSSIAQHLYLGTPVSVEAVLGGLGLITAGDAQ